MVPGPWRSRHGTRHSRAPSDELGDIPSMYVPKARSTMAAISARERLPSGRSRPLVCAFQQAVVHRGGHGLGVPGGGFKVREVRRRLAARGAGGAYQAQAQGQGQGQSQKFAAMFHSVPPMRRSGLRAAPFRVSLFCSKNMIDIVFSCICQVIDVNGVVDALIDTDILIYEQGSKSVLPHQGI